MFARPSLLAVFVAAAAAIGPGDLPSAGTPANDAGNAAFLTVAAAFDSQYYPTAGNTTAGATFSNLNGGFPPVIPGYGKAAVRVWFVSQESSYDNAIGVRIGGMGAQQTVFASDGACTFGDYVDLNGGAKVHQALHFFALSNIVGGNAQFQWHGPTGLNGDGASHLNLSQSISHAGSLWYALALDDQFGGGDRDWNDVRLIVQLIPVAVPEPATIAMFLGFLGVGAWMWRRQRLALA